MFKDIFKRKIVFDGNFANVLDEIKEDNQSQTADVFSEKWVSYDKNVKKKEQQALWDFQKQWYLKLYGFKDEQDLANFLQQQSIVFDAGCGLGYLCEWFASLAPKTIIIGMDISDAIYVAAQKYKNISNIYFIKGDIANTPFKDGVIDYVSCHAVIMHTQNPEATFCELSRVLKDSNVRRVGGHFACYVYAKKALPRELVDDYFRNKCKELSYQELREMSEQLSELGRRLQELKVEFESPEIPLLGIKGENMIYSDLFIGILKCFYNEELGWDTSVVTNFDWYSPSNAKRYTQEEFQQMGVDNNLELLYFHAEEACFGARFTKH